MKLVTGLALLSLAGQGLSFPGFADKVAEAAVQGPKKRQSTGKFTTPSSPPPKFDAAAQLIDVTGVHAFVPPGPDDARGVCPGLNVLANHGYLPHSGVGTIPQYIESSVNVFGMGIDLATFLSVYGAITAGDGYSFSMGGLSKQLPKPLGILPQPRGLNFDHIKFEYDASPTRGDLYLYGEAGDSQVSNFDRLFAAQANVPDDQADYNLEVITPYRYSRVLDSRHRNPYFFNSPFSGIVLQPATYSFIWRLFANKSAEYPYGRLDKETLKSFFAYEGGPGNWTYKPGHERIPDRWYRRAIGDEYGLPLYIPDAIRAAKAYPVFVEAGGNPGKVDSFVGIDASDLTGGVYNAKNLFEGNNFFCYGMQVAQILAPDFLFGVVPSLSDAVGKMNAAIGNLIGGLGCPQLTSVNRGLLAKYPGYSQLRKDGTYP